MIGRLAHADCDYMNNLMKIFQIGVAAPVGRRDCGMKGPGAGGEGPA